MEWNRKTRRNSLADGSDTPLEFSEQGGTATGGGDAPDTRSGLTPLRATLFRESHAMLSYALGAGLKVHPFVVEALDGTGPRKTEEILTAHSSLADLIAPATPRSVMLMHEDRLRHPLLSSFGSVPLVRMFLGIAVASMLLMLLTSLSPQVSRDNMGKTLLDNSGWSLAVCEAFLIFASLVGSAFAALFKLHRYISAGTYDERFASTYWIQLILGVIAGVVLSQVLYSVFPNSVPGAKPAGNYPPTFLQQPVLALIGGFSASLVHRILDRLVLAVESVFGGEVPKSAIPLQAKKPAAGKINALDRRAVSPEPKPALPDAGTPEALPASN